MRLLALRTERWWPVIGHRGPRAPRARIAHEPQGPGGCCLRGQAIERRPVLLGRRHALHRMASAAPELTEERAAFGEHRNGRRLLVAARSERRLAGVTAETPRLDLGQREE